jgi:CubicO group peptidase (beta-lactamase class C family)
LGDPEINLMDNGCKTMYGATRLIAGRSEAVWWGLLIGLVTLLILRPDQSQAWAGEDSAPVPLASRAANSPQPQEVGAFFDRIIPQQLEEYHIPGAAVALVKDGEVVFAGGYGFADLEEERPVDAGRTLFRTGSVGKLFTWTAVMQLAEQGKLDLHADVNDYLSNFQIPEAFSGPITLEHLLTHTAGFEDGPAGMMRARPEDLEPLGTFLGRRVPARIYPPGSVTAYSNYATALAGYIVEEVSGLPFEQYDEENIFGPLGMDRTTFRQPVPAALADDLATGYLYVDGGFQPQPFEVYQIVPAGSTSGTATDMARFMIAHLQEGKPGDGRILGQQTAQLMHQPHFANDPRLAGMAYGFYEVRVNGRLLLTHAGEPRFSRSQLYLLPEDNLGLYVAYNAPGGGIARQELAQAFFDRFYPAPVTALPEPPPGGAQRARLLEGRYVSSRSARTTIEALRLLFDPSFQPITVRATQDGYLETHHPAIRSRDPAAYQPARWVETEPNLYTRTDGRDLLAFRQGPGSATWLFLDSVAPRGYRRLEGTEGLLSQPLVPLGLVALLLGVMAFALFDRQALPAARWLAVGTGVVVLACLVGLVSFAFLGFTDYLLFGRVSPVWWAVFGLPLVFAILAIGLAVFTLRPWPGAGVLRHVPYAVATLAAAGVLVWANHWNVIGWRF